MELLKEINMGSEIEAGSSTWFKVKCTVVKNQQHIYMCIHVYQDTSITNEHVSICKHSDSFKHCWMLVQHRIFSYSNINVNLRWLCSSQSNSRLNPDKCVQDSAHNQLHPLILSQCLEKWDLQGNCSQRIRTLSLVLSAATENFLVILPMNELILSAIAVDAHFAEQTRRL